VTEAPGRGTGARALAPGGIVGWRQHALGVRVLRIRSRILCIGPIYYFVQSTHVRRALRSFVASVSQVSGPRSSPDPVSGDVLCRRPPPPPRQGRVLVVSWVMNGACVNLGKHRVVCGFLWLLRVIDHEAQF
jgi:hypothetical protein